MKIVDCVIIKYMRRLERTLKALANRRRLAILKYLKKEKEASVTEIAGAIRLSFKSTSRHLSILTTADILDKDQRSLQVFYRISDTLPAIANTIIKTI